MVGVRRVWGDARLRRGSDPPDRGRAGVSLDEILIYGTSLCIVVPFVLAMLALHHTSAPERRFWTHAALVFTILYAETLLMLGLPWGVTAPLFMGMLAILLRRRHRAHEGRAGASAAPSGA